MAYGFNDEKEKVNVLSDDDAIDYLKDHIEGTTLTCQEIKVEGKSVTTMDIDWSDFNPRLVSILGMGVYLNDPGILTPYLDTIGIVRITEEPRSGETIRYHITNTDSIYHVVRLVFKLSVLKEPESE